MRNTLKITLEERPELRPPQPCWSAPEPVTWPLRSGPGEAVSMCPAESRAAAAQPKRWFLSGNQGPELPDRLTFKGYFPTAGNAEFWV